jgi:hypothetical protein
MLAVVLAAPALLLPHIYRRRLMPAPVFILAQHTRLFRLLFYFVGISSAVMLMSGSMSLVLLQFGWMYLSLLQLYMVVLFYLYAVASLARRQLRWRWRKVE